MEIALPTLFYFREEPLMASRQVFIISSHSHLAFSIYPYQLSVNTLICLQWAELNRPGNLEQVCVHCTSQKHCLFSFTKAKITK